MRQFYQNTSTRKLVTIIDKVPRRNKDPLYHVEYWPSLYRSWYQEKDFNRVFMKLE